MNVLSITQLNNLIKRTIDREYLLKNVYVSGTITNAKRHSSGHVYFSLKDEESSIDVTMWSSTVQSKGLANAFQNGLLVTIKASVNFYNKMGRLNLIASDMVLKAHYSLNSMRYKENYPHWAILMMLINNQYQFYQVVSVLSHPLQVLFYTIYYILVNIEIRLCNLNYSLYQFREQQRVQS